MKELIDLTGALQRCVKSYQLYADPAHPRCLEAFHDLKHRIETLLDVHERFQIVASQGMVFFDDEPIMEKHQSLSWIAERIGERRISGFVFSRGVELDEIGHLVRIFMLKPQKLEEAGGAAQVLAAGNVRHIRLSHIRYGALRDGEMIVAGDDTNARRSAGDRPSPETSTPGGVPSPGALGARSRHESRDPRGDGNQSGVGFPDLPGDALANEDLLRVLASTIAEWMRDPGHHQAATGADAGTGGGGEGRAGTPGTAGASGEHSGATEGSRGAAAGDGPGSGAGAGTGGSSAGVAEGPGAESGTGTGAGKGPGPGSEVGGGGGGDGTDETMKRERYQQFIASLSRYMREKAVDLELLQRRLHDLGISKDDVEELLSLLAWENLSVDERIRKCVEGATIFDLPLEKVLSFILELLRMGRVDDAILIVKKLGAGFFMESPEARRIATDACNRMTKWLRDPGVPAPMESMIERILLTHFVRGQDADLQLLSQQGFENLYDYWIATQQTDRAYQSLRKLEGAVSAASQEAPWKKKVFVRLVQRLTSVEKMSLLFGQMFAQDVETAAAQYHPLLVFFGDIAALRLLDALESEEDRGRRGRLIKALKTIGKPALYHLSAALTSPNWHLVRNALNLIGDMGAIDLVEDVAATLTHDEERVRRAAARALGRMGGLRAERSLADALAVNEGEMRGEILTSLGSLKADSVLNEILDLMKPRRMGRGDDALRIRAIETVGQIGSNEAIAPLAELLRRRGLFSGSESTDVRTAAAQALAAIGTPAAQDALEAVYAAEPDSQLRDAVTRGPVRRQ